MKEVVRFTYNGLTPNHGKEYFKGNVLLVVYNNGVIKYWPDYANWESVYERDKDGMRLYRLLLNRIAERKR